MRLGAFEPVRQRGAGACGTVDWCHERESQTRTWKAPTDGRSRHRDQGATHSQLTTEHVSPGPGEPPGPFSHALSRIRRPRDSQASLRPTQQRADAQTGAPSQLLCREAGASPRAPGRRPQQAPCWCSLRCLLADEPGGLGDGRVHCVAPRRWTSTVVLWHRLRCRQTLGSGPERSPASVGHVGQRGMLPSVGGGSMIALWVLDAVAAFSVPPAFRRSCSTRTRRW